MKFKQKGFTLIELLVVIAIIGILAIVVVSSLGQARTRANDAAVKGSLSSMRSEVELNYQTSYTNLCSDKGSVYDKFSAGIISKGGDIGINGCISSNSDYRVIAKLPSSVAVAGVDGFCINSLGSAKEVTVTQAESLESPFCFPGEGLNYQYFYCSDHDDCFELGSGNWGIQGGIMVAQQNGGWTMINSASCSNPANSVNSVDCGGSTR